MKETGPHTFTACEFISDRAMPGPACAVTGCNNSYGKTQRSGDNISYHSFPEDKQLKKLWVAACRRKDRWEPEKSLICSAHFKPDDFELDFRPQLSNTKTKRRLKASVYPSAQLYVKKVTNPKQTVGVSSSASHRKCPLCDFTSTLKRECIKHYETKHHIAVERQSISFDTLADLVTWKKSMENETLAKFVRERAMKLQRVTNFICRRSESVAAESKKITVFCPAMIRMVPNGSGRYTVHFTKTHVHQNKMEPLFSSDSEHCGSQAEKIEDISEEEIEMEVKYVKPEPMFDTSSWLNARKEEALRKFGAIVNGITTEDEWDVIDKFMRSVDRTFNNHKPPTLCGQNGSVTVKLEVNDL